jgi:beta-galactosidase
MLRCFPRSGSIGCGWDPELMEIDMTDPECLIRKNGGGLWQIVLVCLLFAAGSPGSAPAQDKTPRERRLLDDGWKFYLGNDWSSGENLMKAGISVGPADPVFCDAAMRRVDLPHDWAVELPFDQKADRNHGFKPVGPNHPENDVGWYRRIFRLSGEDAAKRIWLEFDGVYRDSLVFVNGYRIGRHESGYDSFRCDITDVVNCGGENVVAVRVDASKFEGWFYEGAGIYRHVWLEKTSPLAIAPDGIAVFATFKKNVPSDRVSVEVQTQIANWQEHPGAASITQEVFGPGGKSVGKTRQAVNIGSFTTEETTCKMAFRNPVLWSPESPSLYKLVTTVESGGKVVDRKETEFGVRTFAFDAERGFFLNGKPYVIHGTCNHQDHAGVGSALPDALQYFRIAKLKEFGCNAYRSSHHAPTPELLDACDRLGMLVMDENRLLGSDPENLALLEGQVRRDRNHASVFMWSIANEEHVQASPASALIAETMQRVVHRLDPARPVTCAVSLGDVFEGIDGVMEVRGWNYHLGNGTDDYHRKHPMQPSIGSEQASTVGTRGIYAKDPQRGYLSAYDDNPGATQTAEGWWKFFAARPWLSGGFVWTGFDYRGEPTPSSWPCVSSHFGILDTCGFPKDNFYYYQSWWTDKPVLHLLPHWNWPGREGRDIDVWCDSNCQEVELVLNGQSLGRQKMPRNSHLQWKVKYAPGVLSAIGYDGAKIVAETHVETSGDPAAVQLAPDRASINADGRDVSVVTVSIADAKSRIVPTAGPLVHFEVSGPGRIIGVGNGDPICHEPDVVAGKPAVRSGTMNQWWMKTVSESEAPRAVAEKFNDTRWTWVESSGQSGPLNAGESGVFRARLFLPEADLSLTNIPIRFGSIRDDGWVYVNGKLAGESHDPAASPNYDIRRFLHTGINSVAVLVRSKRGSGGLCGGASVEFRDKPVTAVWSRSAFNGLAQVIVQSGNRAGSIELRARADGLSEGVTIIRALQPVLTGDTPVR